MTTTPTDAPHEPGPGTPPGAPEAHHLGALRRSVADRHIAGVGGGLAQHFRIDPIIVRVALVVLIFFGGAGLILYIGAWLLVPEEGKASAIVRLDERSRAFLLYIVAGLAALALLGETAGHLHAPWPVFVIAVIALLIIGERRGELRLPGRRESASAGSGIAPEPSSQAYAAGHQTQWAPEQTQLRSTDPITTDPITTDPVALTQLRPPAAGGGPTGVPTAPANPRKRGPILFWFTVALIALAEGVLGIVDLAGASVAGPAYPALAVGIIGLMLVLGAFWGRAGGLILLGFVASFVLVGSLAADKWQLDGHGRSVHYTPTSTAALRTDYHLGTGELRLDLSQVSDPTALAGRSISVTGHVGSIEIVVPPQISTTADGVVKGPGQVEIFGEGHGGIHPRNSGSVTGSLTTVPLYIHANLNVGQITVETSDE